MCGPNDGGIKRGDSGRTGDEQAGHQNVVSVHGSGVPGGDGGATGNVTAVPDSLAEPVSGSWVDSGDALEQAGELEGFEIADAEDPMLGLTGIGNRPPEDWAADTGPARDEKEVDEVEPPPDAGHELGEPRA